MESFAVQILTAPISLENDNIFSNECSSYPTTCSPPSLTTKIKINMKIYDSEDKTIN